jgi:hypothetical protein
MKTEDFARARQLEQDTTETRYLIALTRLKMDTAREAVKPLAEAVSYGQPGARVELKAAEARVAEIEQRGKELDARLLSLTREGADLSKWETDAVALAQEFQLSEEQRETLFDALKAGQSREQVKQAAARLRSQNSTASDKERAYSFNAGEMVKL